MKRAALVIWFVAAGLMAAFDPPAKSFGPAQGDPNPSLGADLDGILTAGNTMTASQSISSEAGADVELAPVSGQPVTVTLDGGAALTVTDTAGGTLTVTPADAAESVAIDTVGTSSDLTVTAVGTLTLVGGDAATAITSDAGGVTITDSAETLTISTTGANAIEIAAGTGSALALTSVLGTTITAAGGDITLAPTGDQVVIAGTIEFQDGQGPPPVAHVVGPTDRTLHIRSGTGRGLTLEAANTNINLGISDTVANDVALTVEPGGDLNFDMTGAGGAVAVTLEGGDAVTITDGGGGTLTITPADAAESVAIATTGTSADLSLTAVGTLSLVGGDAATAITSDAGGVTITDSSETLTISTTGANAMSVSAGTGASLTVESVAGDVTVSAASGNVAIAATDFLVNAPQVEITANSGFTIVDSGETLTISTTGANAIAIAAGTGASLAITAADDVSIVPAGGDTTVTGNLTVSGTLALSGTVDTSRVETDVLILDQTNEDTGIARVATATVALTDGSTGLGRLRANVLPARAIGWLCADPTSTTVMTGFGILFSPTETDTSSTSGFDADGCYFEQSSAATTNSTPTLSYTGTTTFGATLTADPHVALTFSLETLTDARFFAGLSSTSSNPGVTSSDQSAIESVIGVRFDTTVDATNWQLLVWDNSSNATVYATGVAATTGVWTVEIDWVSTASCWVMLYEGDGLGTQAAAYHFTSNLPPETEEMRVGVATRSLNNNVVTHRLYFGAMALEAP